MQKDSEAEVSEQENEKAKGVREAGADDVSEASLAEDSAKTESKQPAKSKKILFIIIGAVSFLFMLAGAFFLTPLYEMVMGAEDPEAERRAAEELQAKAVTYLPIPELTINLKKTSSRSRTLTASFVLALENENVRKNVNHFVPMMQDQFNIFLREMDVSDLEGIAGIERVSQEMLIRINRVVAPFQVKDVLVQKFYIR